MTAMSVHHRVSRRSLLCSSRPGRLQHHSIHHRRRTAMSKPSPRTAQPARPAGQPAHWDKPAKFSDGTASAAGSKGAAPANPGKIVVGTQQPVVVTKKPQVVTRRRSSKKKWSFVSIITLLPVLLFASLFSTLLCPPSTAEPSSFSRYALSSIGLAKSPAQHSEFHKALCYPANVYHRDVLVPYVYPALEDAKARLQSHPVYTQNIEPKIKFAKTSACRVWNGPLKPVVDRIVRGAQKVNLTYIQPHVPFVKAKFTEATAPVTLRLQELYKVHLAPHVKVAKSYLCAAAKQAKATYREVVAHPVSKQAHKHGQHAFKLGKHHGYRAYLASRPHAIRAWNEGRRHTRDTIIPRAVQALHFVSNQIAHAWLVIKGNVNDLYQKHAAEHLDPYIKKAQVAVGPYCKLVNDKVYVPYIYPVIASIFPIPEKPRSFWEIISDFVPSPGATNVGNRGSAFYAEDKKEAVEEKAKKVAKEAAKAKENVKAKVDAKAEAVKEKVVPVVESVRKEEKAGIKTAKREAESAKAAAESVNSKIVNSAKAAEEVVAEKVKTVAEHASTAAATHSATASATASSAVDEQTLKADLDKKVATLKKQVDFQAKALYSRIQGETVKNGEHFISLIPELLRMGNENLNREITRMASGLEKLYTNSKVLTLHQIDESQRMSDAKVQKALDQVHNGIKTTQNNIYKKTEPAVEQARQDLDKLVGDEYKALGKQLSLVESTSQKDWNVFHSIKKDVEDWKAKFAHAPTKGTTKQLKDLTHKVEVAAAEVINEFNEVFEGWRERKAQLKRNAVDRVKARIAVEEEEAKNNAKQVKLPRAKPESGRVSILPIAEEKQAAADGNPIIGKAKEQIVDALKQADKIAQESAASLSKAAGDGRVSILPIADQDPAAAREGTPIIGKAKEQVADALKQADEAAPAARDEL